MLLVDLDALEAEARSLASELSISRLQRGLANGRDVQRAIGFAAAERAAPRGFEFQLVEAGVAGGASVAAAALELAAVGGTLVLAPANIAMRRLAGTLTQLGHTVELAGFADAPSAAGDAPFRKLGRECLFVP